MPTAEGCGRGGPISLPVSRLHSRAFSEAARAMKRPEGWKAAAAAGKGGDTPRAWPVRLSHCRGGSRKPPFPSLFSVRKLRPSGCRSAMPQDQPTRSSGGPRGRPSSASCRQHSGFSSDGPPHRRHDHPAAGEESPLRPEALLQQRSADRLALHQVPQPYHAPFPVLSPTPGHGPASVHGDVRPHDRVAVIQRPAAGGEREGIPRPQLAVGAAGPQGLAVGAEGRPRHPLRHRRRYPDRLARGRLPQAKEVLLLL